MLFYNREDSLGVIYEFKVFIFHRSTVEKGSQTHAPATDKKTRPPSCSVGVQSRFPRRLSSRGSQTCSHTSVPHPGKYSVGVQCTVSLPILPANPEHYTRVILSWNSP